MVSALLIISLQYQYQPSPSVLLPWQENASFSVWVNNLCKEAKKRFLSPVPPYLFSLVERAGIWFCAWRKEEIKSLLPPRNDRGGRISLSCWENLGKTPPLKCYSAEVFGVTEFSAVFFFPLWKGSFFFQAIFCALLQQRTGIFFPWTSKYGLLPFSCLRIWNISSLSSVYALLLPV